jgi:hypothetical protein
MAVKNISAVLESGAIVLLWIRSHISPSSDFRLWPTSADLRGAQSGSASWGTSDRAAGAAKLAGAALPVLRLLEQGQHGDWTLGHFDFLSVHRDNKLRVLQKQGHPEHLFGREISDLESENVFCLDV